MNKEVILYGSRKLCTMVYYDALGHKDFKIVGFTQDKEYLNEDGLFLGLPQVSFEQVTTVYPPDQYDMLVLAAGYDCMREREGLYWKAKEKGYTLRNYISASCDIAPDVKMEDNNVIFAQTHIGMSAKIGRNNTIRQQTYIGHETSMGNNNVITPGCKIGGECEIGDFCYIDIGAVIINALKIGDETLVGAGSVVIKNTEACSRNVGNPSRIIGYHKETGIQMRF